MSKCGKRGVRAAVEGAADAPASGGAVGGSGDPPSGPGAPAWIAARFLMRHDGPQPGLFLRDDDDNAGLWLGWHAIGAHPVFVLPGATFGDVAERVVLQTGERDPSLFNQAGTLDEWRQHVSLRCVGNSRLVFALSCAFAAPLLGVAGEDGGGFNLRGNSRVTRSAFPAGLQALHVG